MKQELSILIPTYNDECLQLVKALVGQATAINETLPPDKWLNYEIIVADDGSTASAVIDSNKGIDELPNCRYIIREKNVGRSAIRNFLSRQARYKWLLFVDSDMTIIRKDYLRRYIDTSARIAYGGYCVMGNSRTLKANLRYRYERKWESTHTAQERRKVPYYDFHTSNFLIARDLYLAHPLDERFRHYGYEDVLFGKTLQQLEVKIEHINNPLGFCRFESNEQFVAKTEEGMRTLYSFRHELHDYSRLILLTEKLRHLLLLRPYLLMFRVFRSQWRKRLCSDHVSLRLFSLYKLGYFASI